MSTNPTNPTNSFEEECKSNYTSCNICCDDVLKKACITCMFCKMEICKTCCKQYLLNQTVAKCMNLECNRLWDDFFIRTNFETNWVEKQYKTHQKNMLFETEKSYLPETQEYVYFYTDFKKAKTENENIIKEHTLTIESLENDKSSLIYELKSIKDSSLKKQIKDTIDRIKTKIYSSKSILRNSSSKVFTTEHTLKSQLSYTVKTGPVKLFVRPCIKIDCKGYLNKEDWSCGLCSIKVCKTCHFESNINHKCKKEDIDSAKLIESTTKPCPKCGARIHKTEGCDHMFCTSCKTGFSWETGRLLRDSENTNPYFYRYMATLNNDQRNPLPIQNNGCVQSSSYQIERLAKQKKLVDLIPIISDTHDIQTIIGDVRIALNQLQLSEYDPSKNRLARIKYLANDIDQKQLLTEAAKHYKRLQYNNQLFHLFTMFLTSLQDCLNNIYTYVEQITIENKSQQITQICSTLEQFEALIQYFNTQSLYIAKCFDYSIFVGFKPSIKRIKRFNYIYYKNIPCQEKNDKKNAVNTIELFNLTLN